jgi:SAM-dependent methyltransferase
LAEIARETRQLLLFDSFDAFDCLDSRLWRGSFGARESTLQQLSPYVGKMKSGMAKVLINLYSRQGDTVLDPFSGSGVVPLEAVLSGRRAWANDLSPYAYVLTRGKLEAPGSERAAVQNAESLVDSVEREAPSVDITSIPNWVKEFFHPETLREVFSAFRILRESEDFFLTACLLGILHHVRPGFLSYPASHLVPYLRRAKYPPDKFEEMYTYRDLRSRLVAKVRRAYRRSLLPLDWEGRQFKVWMTNSMSLPIDGETVDAIVSSPPYFGALDYARDNRLRLWFLGCEDWKVLDSSLTANSKVYLPQMSTCLKEMCRVLKPEGRCILVLGDVDRDGQTRRTAEILADLANQVTQDRFAVETIYDDRIPDERRSRRRTRTTKFERILVMRKRSCTP